MSRIGKQPITIPAGVSIDINNTGLVTVNGPLGTLSRNINTKLATRIEGNVLYIENKNNDIELRKFHGLYRQLINNMVEGVSKGFSKSLNINGVGYRVTQNGDNLTLNIGFSHPVEVKAVPNIKLSCEKTEIKVSGIDKELVGQFAAKIRNIKPVEPYHLYGISYTTEKLQKKEVKSGKK